MVSGKAYHTETNATAQCRKAKNSVPATPFNHGLHIPVAVFMPFWFPKQAVLSSKTACFRTQNGTFHNPVYKWLLINGLQKAFQQPETDALPRPESSVETELPFVAVMPD